MSTDWERAGAAKRDAVNELIPLEWRLASIPTAAEQKDVTGDYIRQLLSKEEFEITETDVVGIAQKTTSGQWKAYDVARAFCHRAALAHQLTNCLLEIFFDPALTHAKELDEYLAKNKRPLGPLHGVPISLKDQFHVKGVETTMGYVGWIGTFQGLKGTGKERQFESELTVELLTLGAVLYCKTSVPHTLMCGETDNHIMGTCVSPRNRYLTCGGSSGGEGALIGMKGSPLGFGTDIGGSVRIPAALNGIWGLRPSTGRIPYQGAANSMDGQNSILSTVGPLATSARSLKYITQAILSQQPWLHDPLVHEIPWRDDQEKSIADILSGTGKLAFGVYRSDGRVRPQPAVARALELVVQTVKKLGHEVIEWTPDPTHIELESICWRAFGSDGGRDVRKDVGLSGEPFIHQVKSYNDEGPESTASGLAELNRDRREAQKKYMDYWNSTSRQTTTGRPVDAVLCPVAPVAGARPTKYTYYTYTIFLNALDYSSVVLPVTTVNQEIDKYPADFEPLSQQEQDIAASYEPDVQDGAPVGIQIFARRLQEEKILAIASHVGEHLPGK